MEQDQIPSTKARYDALYALVQDPKSHPGEISRLILLEMILAAIRIRSRQFTPDAASLNELDLMLVKVLREAGKQVLLSEVLRKKADVLWFDGPKFKFVFGRIYALFVKAMEEAGVQENQRANVIRHYRDLMGMEEATIRRETEKLGNNPAS